MRLSFLTFFYFVYFSISVHAQFPIETKKLEEDNNIIFMKANVLFNSDRYDEAVRMYNRILRDDPDFSRALFMRGKAKFALGAFKGTKSDMLDYIDKKGINKDVIEIMANTELNLDNQLNALSYFDMLTLLEPYESRHLVKAAAIAYDHENKNKACEYWVKSAKLGNAEGAREAKLKCAYDQSIHLPSRSESQNTEADTPEIENDSEEEIQEKENAKDGEEHFEEREYIDVSVKSTSPNVDMDASQEIEVDDELTLIFNSGLGMRKVDNTPNILMLSDKSGKVVLDLCIGAEGKVNSVVLNNKLTTIFRSSLTSLAIRKAKEFVFMPSLVDEQCGLLIFDIRTD